MNCALCKDNSCTANIPCDKLPTGESKIKRSVYLEDPETKRIYSAASEIPKDIPRIEEVSLFIERINIKRVGVAFCKGLQSEASKVTEFLTSVSSAELFPVICAYEDINKSIANSEEAVISCNPVGQADLLNGLNTQLNITIGLCVGHDILFSKYSKAPVTNLVVKDRVCKHKPLDFFSQ